MIGFVYILQNTKNGKFYIGSTIDIERRFKEHNDGKVAATRFLLPVNLVFFQKYEDIKIARKIEFKLKRFKRKDIIERIIKEKQIRIMGV